MIRSSAAAVVLSLALALTGVAFAGEELSPEKVARIRREEAAALKKVDEKYGKRSAAELSNAERRQLIADQQAASRSVLSRHGVTEKDWLLYTSRMSRGDQAAAEAESKRLEAEAKAAEEKKKASSGPAEVEIQRGFGDGKPVQLEEAEGAPPEVEYMTPAEAQ